MFLSPSRGKISLENIDEPGSDNYPPGGDLSKVRGFGRTLMKLRYFFGAVVVPGALALAPAALAAGSVKAGYGGGAGVQDEVQAAGVAASGSLPFTGLDLALLVAGGLILLVMGMFLRRAAKRTT